MTHSPAYCFGQALAVIHKAMPQGLTPTSVNNAMALPASHFGGLVARAQPYMTPDLSRMMAEIVDNIHVWPDALTVVQQGDCWIGWHHQIRRMGA